MPIRRWCGSSAAARCAASFSDDIAAWAQESFARQGFACWRVSQVDELVRALQDVCRGGSALDPKIVEGLMNRRSRESKSPLRALTERERDVLAEMATGKNNAAVARSLFLSDRAVEKHIGVVFQILGLIDEGEVNRRVKAVLAFLEASGPHA